MDPDPGIHASYNTDFQEQKLILNKFFCILPFEGIFSSFFIDKKSKRSHKTVEIKVFLNDRRIRIRIHTSVWIRIQEAQKHVDPDSDPDPQHCLTHPTEVEGCLVVDRLGRGAEAEESDQAGGAHEPAVVGPLAVVVVVQAVSAHVHNNLKQELLFSNSNTAGGPPTTPTTD